MPYMRFGKIFYKRVIIRMLEKDIQKTIIEWLSLKRIFFYRNNSGMVFMANRDGTKRAMRVGAVGSPDLVCVLGGRYIGIECKKKGGKMSDSQHIFKEKLEKSGGKYILAFSLDDVIAGMV